MNPRNAYICVLQQAISDCLIELPATHKYYLQQCMECGTRKNELAPGIRQRVARGQVQRPRWEVSVRALQVGA
jgi:hypothetical protein